MKKIIYLIVMGSVFSLPCLAQGGYTISGKVRGITTDKVHVVAADFGKTDTLASATVANGTFLLNGTVPGGVRAVNLVFPGVDGTVPLLLENTNYQLQVTATGAMVDGGGAAAELYKAFNKIGQDYAAKEAAITADYESDGSNPSKTDALQFRLDEAYRSSVQQMLDLIQANADEYVSAYVVALGIQTDTEELLRRKYEALGEAAKATVPGKAVAEALARYGNLVIGKPAPDFTVTRPNGDALTLSAVPAKYKLVVFWASWDNASRAANPQFIQLYQQFRPRSFEIVSVSLDDNRFAWDRAIDEDGISIWSNGSDLLGTDSPVAKAYMVGSALPYTVLIDDENKIVAKGLLGDDLRKAIADLTKRKRKE